MEEFNAEVVESLMGARLSFAADRKSLLYVAVNINDRVSVPAYVVRRNRSRILSLRAPYINES